METKIGRKEAGLFYLYKVADGFWDGRKFQTFLDGRIVILVNPVVAERFNRRDLQALIHQMCWPFCDIIYALTG